MTQSSPYPVLEERPLARAGRRVISRSRDLTELPKQQPGTVLVFEVGSGYLAFTERRHLAGREDLVVNAVSVSLVDVRPQTLTVQLNLPSSDPSDEFIVLVDFYCAVVEPEQVAAAGLRDLTGTLRHYLRQDPALVQLATTRSIRQINDVRLEITSRIEAYYRLRAPRIVGMKVELLNMRVVTPRDLADHVRRMRDERWRQDHEGLVHDGEDRNAGRMREYFEGGATAVAGLAAARGELDLNQATQREYEVMQNKRHELIELWKSLPEAYQDTVAVDAQRIVDSVFDQILGSSPTSQQLADGAQQNRPMVGNGEKDDHGDRA
jgi:hypothetical protein